MYMPVATHSIVFARIVPSELNIVTAENNNVIDLALQTQLKAQEAINPSTTNTVCPSTKIKFNKVGFVAFQFLIGRQF